MEQQLFIIWNENGYSVIVSNFLKYGADPNLGRYVKLMILRASSKGHTEVVTQMVIMIYFERSL